MTTKNNRYQSTDRGKFITSKCNWEKHGIYFEDEDEARRWYDRYNTTLRCEACDVELTTGRTGQYHKVLDHDHETGKPRGVLCDRCNRTLGTFEIHIKGYYEKHCTGRVAID